MRPQPSGFALGMWFASRPSIRREGSSGSACNLIVMKFLGRQGPLRLWLFRRYSGQVAFTGLWSVRLSVDVFAVAAPNFAEYKSLLRVK